MPKKRLSKNPWWGSSLVATSTREMTHIHGLTNWFHSMSVTKMAGICSLNPTTLMTFKVTSKGPTFKLFIRSEFQFSSWISLFFLGNLLALIWQRIHVIRCCSGATDNENKSQTRTKTPQILKLAVSGVTELLRVFSFSGKDRYLPCYSPSSIAFSAWFLGRCHRAFNFCLLSVLILISADGF